MKIHGGRPPENADVVRIGNASKNSKLEGKREAAVSDRVDLSGGAKEIADLRGILNALPEIRQEKVSEIRNLIETGKYVPDPDKIAGRMIDEIV
ncbi:MAG: flagellar biosynthesis anti-sigma factor FlgM [Thermodesulfobacteriota bacterium]